MLRRTRPLHRACGLHRVGELTRARRLAGTSALRCARVLRRTRSLHRVSGLHCVDTLHRDSMMLPCVGGLLRVRGSVLRLPRGSHLLRRRVGGLFHSRSRAVARGLPGTGELPWGDSLPRA
ncbi:hypothetical protein ACFU99_43150, partial [Streptomyces sp. NPDC057654]|uniref:hypothetical protein n=1 Tax=Streptomyces sp. NPDC057654 TaxID=3346196 RepID=UPI003692C2C7